MYKKILVPMALDHNLSPHMLNVARTLGDDGAEIIALHVYEEPQGSAAALLDEEFFKRGQARALDLMREKLGGIGDVTPVMIQGHTNRTIVEYAANNGIDCIVMGSHRPGLSDYLLGSTAARVVRHAPCAVHVVRNS